MMWTHREFYKGFRGNARSRKLGQPGQPGSCSTYIHTSLYHDYLDLYGLIHFKNSKWRIQGGEWIQFLFFIKKDVIVTSLLLLKIMRVLANFLILLLGHLMI